MFKIIAIAFVCFAALWTWETSNPFMFAKPAVLEQDPIQEEVSIAPFAFKPHLTLFPRTFVIEPQASYDITARVLHKRQYFSNSLYGDILPFDIGLGWKNSGNLDLLRYMSFTHTFTENNGVGRFLIWRYKWTKDMPPECDAPGPEETGLP